jgi:hypothetical protein
MDKAQFDMGYVMANIRNGECTDGLSATPAT